ncbi:neutral/alkaline non-lysosomal ceramidase N-terminal domain-containing protein [Thalassoroseus pseudoceratinae]|uniref:neutral/alkaline non-lysosomal ceramidase N-terminal domain-containing protein n=1 Tax=Thalassoroseus pseudoceratinae TaxID=2713176 RepID=UPI001423AD0A|nr:neutral/alkaline non-lysosomal ceramidase N-terminal domain-containing protein [Thalassoroseus pseudoceratinae]
MRVETVNVTRMQPVRRRQSQIPLDETGNRNRFDWRFICLAIPILLIACRPAVGGDVYDVGVSAVDITPTYPIRLNGFGNRREESEGVSQPIYAKALAIAEHSDSPSAKSPLVLVTLDSLGIRQSMRDRVAQELKKSHGVPAENLVITFTHSHCTPKVNGACDNIFSQAIPESHQKHIDRYTKELTNSITKAARQALDSMRPAHLERATGSAHFAKNRRTVGGPTDHDLPMLVVRDLKSGQPRAIYVSYACHCVTLSFNQISGDWAGYAAAMIERRFPDCVAMVSIGAGSDQNPISGVTGDNVQVAEGQGVEIATEVERLLSGKLTRISGPATAVYRRIKLPLNPPPTREELVAQTQKGRPTDRYNAQTQLQRLDRGESLLTEIDYPIQTWTFGDSFCMTFLAGEVCVDYAKRLKSEFDHDRFWLNTYSNDFCCYIPSERLLEEGGYGGGGEVPYFALPNTLKAGLEDQIVEEVHRQIPRSFSVAAGTRGIAPKSPEESLKTMQVAADLQVVLAAAEPAISDPVAIDFGPDGSLWVAEMNDYGRDVYENFQQQGRIRRLRDADGDGFFEVAKTFVDGLRFPTDVKVWREGVLICDAPDILYAQDTNGDGQADKVTQLFTGFEVRNAQARVNSLRLGLDNWVYGASGLFGGLITNPQTGKTVDCRNRDFRIKPDEGIIQPVNGRTQQGRCRNDWGDWFGCSNGTLLRPIPSDEKYQARNPLASPAAVPVVRIAEEAHQLLPPENLVRFALSGAPGRATSACGLGIYRDTLLGKEFLNDAFTCEPVHQSVHRIDFREGNPVFSGTRGESEEDREFLSSNDRWFRPVQARTGPDGALWVVDMYRFVIEHSRWIPQSTRDELDVYAGQGRGRIYRVLPRGTASTTDNTTKTASVLPDLQRLSTTELAKRLDSSNGTLRDLVHQKLLWQNATDAAASIREIIKNSEHPAAQLQALSVLKGLNQLTADDVLRGLGTSSPDVQRFAVELSEQFLDESAELRTAVVALADHKDMRLRRQVAFSLGAGHSPEFSAAIARLASGAESSTYVRSAALNSVSSKNIQQVLQAFTDLPTSNHDSASWKKLLELAVQFGDADTLHAVFTKHLPTVEPLPTKTAAELWITVLTATDRRSAQDHMPEELAKVEQIQKLFQNALATVRATNETSEKYEAAFKLLGRQFGSFSKSAVEASSISNRFSANKRASYLARFLSPRYPAKLQRDALTAVVATGAEDMPKLLMRAYASLGNDIRFAIIDTMLNQKNGPAVLVKALETGTVRADRFDANRREKLLSRIAVEQRSQAEKALGASGQSNRAEIVKEMLSSLKPGNVEHGRTKFRKHCASCHRLEDYGHAVGPNLQALTVRDPAWLLAAILDPNQQVDARYLSWTIATTDGRVTAGLLVDESSTSVRLRESGGKEHSIARDEIEVMQSSQKSLMPEGLERDLSSHDLSDVIAYLGSFQQPAKRLPGNQPQVVRPDDDGVLKLTATVAEIRGKDITFETDFSNIGYWHDQGDSAVWQIDLPKPGEYDVYLNFACVGSAAGNSFRVDGLPNPIVGKVASTGGWDRYRQPKIGRTTLTAGRHSIIMRAAEPVEQALFDLREIRLVPVGQAPRFAASDITETPLPRRAPEIAPFLLDETQSVERRQQAIDQRPGMGPAIIGILTADLDPKDMKEQYRRIPWIWRVSIAVAKRNDGGEIRDLLEISVPKAGHPLEDWQAVVIGGGLINGATQIGLWPDQRIDEILQGLPAVKAAWPEALDKAVKMAHDEQVRSGTRYDALRMIALLEPDDAIVELKKYLNSSRELQMGAVSGLADIDTDTATELLASALAHLEGRNRQLAIEALLRTDRRAKSLVTLISEKKLVLSNKEMLALRQHTLPSLKQRYKTMIEPIIGQP